MTTHPMIAYELAIAHREAIVANAAPALVASGRASGSPLTALRPALVGLGSLLIAAGERIGGARVAVAR
jgi:hypothetical protein